MAYELFLRPSGQCYMTAEYPGQNCKDLYSLAQTRGAFRESEIGSVAMQLLT